MQNRPEVLICECASKQASKQEVVNNNYSNNKI